jgi:small subunit ribosomal protein S17
MSKKPVTEKSTQKGIVNIGIDVKAPEKRCENDKKCPFHGSLSLRGRTFVGRVVRCSLGKNALVEMHWQKFLPKYERFEKKRTRIMAHNPQCISAVEGDDVRIMETRKLSKTKNFVVIEKLSIGTQAKAAKQ